MRLGTDRLAAVVLAAALATACGSGDGDEDALAAQRSTSTSVSTSAVAALDASTTTVAGATTIPGSATAPPPGAAATTAPRAAATTPATNPPETAAPTTAAPTTTRPPDIVIQNFMFSPATKSVPRSSPVKVDNRDGASHTFTPNTGGAWPPCTLSGGQSCTITAPAAPGSYTYRCDFHPTMTGTLTVT